MKRWIAGILLLGCLGLALPVCGYFYWTKTERDALHSAVAEIKRAGLPLERRDFFPEIPAHDENAAPLLKRAAEIVNAMPKDSPALRCVPGIPGTSNKNNTVLLPDDELAAIRSFFAKPAAVEALQLLNKAATKEKCDFARNYEKGAFMELPDAGPMLMAIRLLLNHAWCMAKEGNAADAVLEIRSAMKICSFYMDDPILIAWLVGVSCEQMCLSTTMDLVSAAEVTPGEIEELERCVETHRKMARTSLVRSLDGERVFFVGTLFDQFLSRKIAAKDTLSAVFGYEKNTGMEMRPYAFFLWIYQNPLRPLLIADYAAYLRFMLGIRKVILDPQSGEREARELINEIPRTALLTRLSAPALDSTACKLHEVEAALDLALIGLHVEKFRIANGHYPQHLSEVPWEGPLPTDPFTGGEFHYKASDGNLLIYSVGTDLADNQGNPAKVKGQRDIVWSVQHSVLPAKSR